MRSVKKKHDTGIDGGELTAIPAPAALNSAGAVTEIEQNTDFTLIPPSDATAPPAHIPAPPPPLNADAALTLPPIENGAAGILDAVNAVCDDDHYRRVFNEWVQAGRPRAIKPFNESLPPALRKTDIKHIARDLKREWALLGLLDSE